MSRNKTDENSGFQKALPLLCAIQLALLGLAIVGGYWLKHYWWQDLQITPWLFAAAGFGLGLAALSNRLFLYLARRIALIDWFINAFMGPLVRNTPFPTSLLLSSLSGICEEALFRGLLLNIFGLWPSSVIFALAHTGDRRLIPQALWAGLVGLILGLLYISTNNLAICMVIHVSCNLYSFTKGANWEPPARETN